MVVFGDVAVSLKNNFYALGYYHGRGRHVVSKHSVFRLVVDSVYFGNGDDWLVGGLSLSRYYLALRAKDADSSLDVARDAVAVQRGLFPARAISRSIAVRQPDSANNLYL